MNGIGLDCSNPTCSHAAWIMTVDGDERIGTWLAKNGWTRDPEVEDGWLCERCSA